MTSLEDAGSPVARVGWGRAIMIGAGVLIVGFGGAVGGANAIMTRLTGVSRNVRQWLATALFLLVVVGLAWVLRRLQARGSI